jgi:hypothetical protein
MIKFENNNTAYAISEFKNIEDSAQVNYNLNQDYKIFCFFKENKIFVKKDINIRFECHTTYYIFESMQELVSWLRNDIRLDI